MNSVIELTPLTRVEGHGKVRVYFDGKRAESVQLSLCESPRLFKALLLGKLYGEVPEIVCRICSICSSVHRVTALLAVENAFGVQVSDQTRLYRELLVNGGQIASHALHLFCLVLPDHFGASGFAGLSACAPEELQRGLRIKAVGNLIQETVGGRLIHPVTPIPGGMGKPVAREGLLRLQEALQAILPDTRETYRLFRSFAPPATVLARPCYLATRSDEGPPLFGDQLTLGDDHAVPVEAYRELLREEVIDYSNAKRVTAEGRLVTVGALARLNLGAKLASEAAQEFYDARARLIAADIRGNSLAQAVELTQAIERSLELIARLLAEGFRREAPVTISPRKGSGTAVMEAPRGVLIHSYGFDSRGYCTAADVITPTAINQAAMEQDLLTLARQLEGMDDADLQLQLEMLVRAYDPCISCAIHLVRR